MAMINLANVASSCCHSIGTATATKDARSKGITLPNDNSNPNVGSHPSKFSLILAMLVVLGLFFGWIMLADSISSSTNTTKLISPLSYEKTGFITQDSKTRYLTAIDQMGETFRVTKTESGVWQITKSQSVTGTRSLKLDPVTKYYQYTGPDRSIWFRYNTNYEQPHWQCWYPPISDDYNQSGWMEYRDGSWYIESDEGKWIVLPEQYDTTYLFTIQTSVG